MTHHRPMGGPVILLIEDMQGSAGELIASLADEGYEVHTATTGEDAIRSLVSTCYAAVLLDIELPLGEAEQTRIPTGTPPERSGIEVLRYLRGELGLTDLPVVVVSGLDHRAFWSDMTHELRSEQLHVSAIVVKPTGPREVIRALSRETGWQGPMHRAFKADDPTYGE